MAELSGWKAIASHLGKSERMCRYYLTWSPPLPAYRFGDAGEIVADSEQLDAWKKSMMRHASFAPAASRCRRLPADRKKVRRAKVKRDAAIAE